MSADLEMRVMELLSARLCHELAGPIAAVANGVELTEEEDPAFVRSALSLIGTSARTASRRLQFYRFAYGTLPGDGASKSIGRDLALKFFEDGSVRCDWTESDIGWPQEWQRLICSVLALAAEALPRGGVVTLGGDGGGFRVEAQGEDVRLSPEAQAALTADPGLEHLTHRGVHAHWCVRLAATLGARIAIARREPRRVEFAVET
jgi:histidine phosphotransferase ChpT